MSLGRAIIVAAIAIAPALVFGAMYYTRHADHLRVSKINDDYSRFKAQFPLHIAPGTRYLTDAAGNPFLIDGEAAWSILAQLRHNDADAYLEDRRRRGVNLIVVNLIEHWFADHAPNNAYGVPPFEQLGDFSKPIDKYYEYAQEIVSLAESKGIVVLLCPAYLGGDGGNEGWYGEMRKNGPDILHQFGRYVGQRFKKFHNIIWLQGGDYTPPEADLGLVAAVASGIREAAPTQMQTAHWSPETSALDVNFDAALDLNTTYTYLPAYLKSLIDHNHGAVRTHFLVESKYEGDELGSTQRSLRGQAYYALLTGAAGQVHGNRWIWPFVKPSIWNRIFARNWQSALDSPMSRSMGYLHRLFSKIPWHQLAPDETYKILISGQGSKGKIDYPALAWQTNGNLAVAYVPTMQGVRINLQHLVGPLRANWYDPTNGNLIPVAGSPLVAQGEREFLPPSKNASGDTDWVLLLQTNIEPLQAVGQ